MDTDTNTKMLAKIEAILFSEGGEMKTSAVADILGVSKGALGEIVEQYNNSNRGVVLVQDEDKIIMRTASEYADIIETLRKDSLNAEISKAGLEVLAIVLYSDGGSISANEIEHVRGVNSGYTLRQLAVRGLLNKKRVGMSYKYLPTAELLAFLGITNSSVLPQREHVQHQLAEFITTKEEAKLE